MNNLKRVAQLSALTLLFCVLPVYGHPHLFLEQQIEAVFNEAGLSHIRLHWQLCEMSYWVLMLLAELDPETGRVPNERETSVLKSSIFELLSHETGEPFKLFRIDSRLFFPEKIDVFHTSWQDGKFVINMSFPVDHKVQTEFVPFYVSLCDPAFYTVILPCPDKPVSISSHEMIQVELIDPTSDSIEVPTRSFYEENFLYGLDEPWLELFKFRLRD